MYKLKDLKIKLNPFEDFYSLIEEVKFQAIEMVKIHTCLIKMDIEYKKRVDDDIDLVGTAIYYRINFPVEFNKFFVIILLTNFYQLEKLRYKQTNIH